MRSRCPAIENARGAEHRRTTIEGLRRPSCKGFSNRVLDEVVPRRAAIRNAPMGRRHRVAHAAERRKSAYSARSDIACERECYNAAGQCDNAKERSWRLGRSRMWRMQHDMRTHTHTPNTECCHRRQPCRNESNHRAMIHVKLPSLRAQFYCLTWMRTSTLARQRAPRPQCTPMFAPAPASTSPA